MLYTISLDGCDDTTPFEVEMTPEQKAFVDRMVEAAKAASRHGCMPTMSVREGGLEKDDDESADSLTS